MATPFAQARDDSLDKNFGRRSTGDDALVRTLALQVLRGGDQLADKIMPRLAERSRTLKIADGTIEDAEMRPIITREAVQRISDCIEEGRASGASVVVDGRVDHQSGERFTVEGSEQGFWLGGTLFDPVQPDMNRS